MKVPLPRTMAVLVLAAAIIGLTMSTAIWRGMHHAMAIGPGDQTAIAISLSSSVYNIEFGYIGLKQVADKIHEHWNRGAQGWTDLETLKVNYRDAGLLNAGIRAAASLASPTPGFVSDGTLISMNSKDIGQVDYVTLAFRLFGLQIESLFYFYFTIVGLSALVFILTFRDDVHALAIVLCTLAAYFIALHLAVFDSVATPTYFGMQHGATMCLVAMWHFVFLLVSKRKPTPWVVVGAVVQLAILILAWRMRGTTWWVFALLVLLALVAARPHLRLRQFGRLQFRPPGFGRFARAFRRATVVAAKSTIPFAEKALRWPIILLFAGVLGSSLYDRAALHPVYSTDDVMPGRGFWSDAFLGLAAYDPHLLGPRVATAARRLGPGEELRWWATRDYMDRIRLARWDGRLDPSQPAPGLKSEWTGVGLRAAFQEQMARGAFIDAVKNRPVRALLVYVVKKPRHILKMLFAPFVHPRSTISFLLSTVLVGAGVVALFRRYGGGGGLRGPRDVLLLGGGAVLAAATPGLWGYPGQPVLADSVLLLAAFLPIAVGMGAMRILRDR